MTLAEEIEAIHARVIPVVRYLNTNLLDMPTWLMDNAEALRDRLVLLAEVDKEKPDFSELFDFARAQYDVELYLHKNKLEIEREHYDSERSRREACSNVDPVAGLRRSGEL